MKNVVINEIPLRFDMGTVMLIADHTGKPLENLLEGVNGFDRPAVILYAAMARLQEKADQPITVTFNQAKNLLKDMKIGHLAELSAQLTNVLSIDADEEEQPNKEETKEPKKRSR